jgi:ATP-dependent DNA helicase DinG
MTASDPTTALTVRPPAADDADGADGADYLTEVFGDGGTLAHTLPGYRPRPSQLAMARAVDRALADHGCLTVEAPTGTGKTFAYGVPLAYHVDHTPDTRGLIVTAGLALQSQLIRKDLPQIMSVLPWGGCTFAILKGRNNYLCKHQLSGYDSHDPPPYLEPEEEEQFVQLWDWSQDTRTGDHDDLPFAPTPELWSQVSVQTKDCLGQACHHYDACWAQQAKQKAFSAQIVVTNYHLFFAHAQAQANSETEIKILPAHDFVICDEAHEMADIARTVFGNHLTQLGLQRLPARLPAELRDLSAVVKDQAKECFKQLRQIHDRQPDHPRLQSAPDCDWEPLYDTLRQVGARYSALTSEQITEDKGQRAEYRNRARLTFTAADGLKDFCTLANPKLVYYLAANEKTRSVALVSQQIEVGTDLARYVFNGDYPIALTSATLTTGGNFSFLDRELGLPEAHASLTVPSPFNLTDQALLIIPDLGVDPPAPEYKQRVAEALAEVVEHAQGRTLALFTSRAGLKVAHDHLLRSGCEHRILTQSDGDLPKAQLVTEFTRDVHSILLGLRSMWQGIDVPGEACSVVFIDKVQFDRPNEPLVEALAEIDPESFTHYTIPRSIIALKQGLGRLIRTATDRGVAVICDRRLLPDKRYKPPREPKGYSKIIRESLPFPLRSRYLVDVANWLERKPRYLPSGPAAPKRLAPPKPTIPF